MARGSAAALRRLFQLSPALVCIAGEDGYFKRLNPAFEFTLGYSRDELLARPFVEFVHPEDRDKTLDELRRLSQGIPTAHFENRYRCKDGSYRWLSWVAMPEPTQGLIYATALDITEQKRESERFRLIVETASDAVVVVANRGNIVLASAPAEKLFGYASEELLGQPIEILIPERQRAAHLAHRDHYSADPRPRRMGERSELRALRKDGSEFPAEISLSVLRTENETLISAVIRDLTERNRINEALLKNEAQILAAQRIQRYLLPRGSPSMRGIDVAASVFPAEFACGDHFDYLQLSDGCVGLVVSDVSGHGFAAALLAASTQTTLRVLARSHWDVGEILTLTNSILFDATDEQHFVTAFLGSFDPTSRRLRYVSAGHSPCYVFDSQGDLKNSLESSAVPLGMMPSTRYLATEPAILDPGDILVLTTDGIVEATARDGSYFGVGRVHEVVRMNRTRSAEDIIGSLHRTVCEFTHRAKLEDDLTLLVLKVER